MVFVVSILGIFISFFYFRKCWGNHTSVSYGRIYLVLSPISLRFKNYLFMIKLVVSTFFMLNFLATKAYSECEFSPKNYQRTHKNEEFTLYVARETVEPNDLNFSEYKCRITYDYVYYENTGADRWFECSNKMTIFEHIPSPASNEPEPSLWHLHDASRENTDKIPLRLIEKSSTEEKYYQTDPVDCSLIIQELISDFVYENTADPYLNKQIFRLKRRYQFQFSPKEEENWL